MQASSGVNPPAPEHLLDRLLKGLPEAELFASLNKRRQAFCRAYILDANATKAATLAGYSARSARQCGYVLTGAPEVAIVLKAAMRSRSNSLADQAARTVAEYEIIAFANIRDYATWGAGGGLVLKELAPARDPNRIAIKRYDVRDGKYGRKTSITLHDKHEALTFLGKLSAFY